MSTPPVIGRGNFVFVLYHLGVHAWLRFMIYMLTITNLRIGQAIGPSLTANVDWIFFYQFFFFVFDFAGTFNSTFHPIDHDRCVLCSNIYGIIVTKRIDCHLPLDQGRRSIGRTFGIRTRTRHSICFDSYSSRCTVNCFSHGRIDW